MISKFHYCLLFALGSDSWPYQTKEISFSDFTKNHYYNHYYYKCSFYIYWGDSGFIPSFNLLMWWSTLLCCLRWSYPWNLVINLLFWKYCSTPLTTIWGRAIASVLIRESGTWFPFVYFSRLEHMLHRESYPAFQLFEEICIRWFVPWNLGKCTCFAVYIFVARVVATDST